jgi:hypothetical protein
VNGLRFVGNWSEFLENPEGNSEESSRKNQENSKTEASINEINKLLH